MNLGNFYNTLNFYSGGMEIYFDNKKSLELDIGDKDITMEGLIDDLKRNHLREKEEMFV